VVGYSTSKAGLMRERDGSMAPLVALGNFPEELRLSTRQHSSGREERAEGLMPEVERCYDMLIVVAIM
jgi:hypothetical protein